MIDKNQFNSVMECFSKIPINRKNHICHKNN